MLTMFVRAIRTLIRIVPSLEGETVMISENDNDTF